MAMLAEPRRKKRYNLVPKGKPLFEDGDRFGTKMLEKMGWSKGKGLGSREDGQQDFIRINYKNDVDGLGFVERDDQWTEHEKHFNGLLDTLNGENSSSKNASGECQVVAPTVGFGFKSKSGGKEKLTDKLSGQSLEEKSKNSKARVHYKKFTKGKDMAQYSEKDLANIFGKKASPDDDNIYSQFQAFNSGDGKEVTVPLESGINIINTGLSVSDYFKLKMEAKKGVTLENGVANVEDEVSIKKEKTNKKTSNEENPESTEIPAKELGTQIINTGVSVNDYFKAKMAALKQKKGLSVDNNIEAGEDMACVAPIESDLFLTEEAPTKKKKKNKKRHVDEVLSEDPPVAEDSEISTKKKKKNSIGIQNETKSSALETSSVGQFEDGIPLKNKKSKKRSAEEVVATDDTQSLNNISKKLKIETPEEPPADTTEIRKKKKNKQSESVQSTVTETQDEAEISQLEEEAFAIKKTPLTSETLPLVPSPNEITSKKKKNKKSSAVEKPAELPESTEVPKKKQKNKHANSAEPPSKKKTNKTNTNATIPTEVSSQHKLIPVKDDCLLDTYTISTFCAEKFRNIELQKFAASTISQINGYGLSENLELNIKIIKNDQQRIMRLWSGTLDKYQHATPKHKIYSNYMTKAKQARRAKNKIPKIKIKCLKRKHVFQCL